MKQIIISLFLGFAIQAQVAVGKAALSIIPSTTTPNPSISLEFGDYSAGQGMGLIVPWVNSAANMGTAVTGTIVYDTTDKIIKYKTSSSTWYSLSKNEIFTVDGTASFDTTGTVNTSLQDSLTDSATSKVSIGQVSSVPGILVLEDSNKAMVLPKVPNPHLNVVNPEPGTMVYDTVSKQLAVYNGTVWSFWKP